MKFTIIVAVTALALSPQIAAAQAPSAIAAAIMDRVQQVHPAGSLCGDDSKLEGAVREATLALLSEGVITGRPRAEAQEVAAAIMQACG